MILVDSLHTLDWWGCIVAAFLPGLLIALMALPIGHRMKAASDDAEARNRLIALVAAAFAFIVAFTTNTLWTQDLAIAESARTVGQSTSEMRQAARQVDPDFADQTRSLLQEFDQASEANDLDAGLNEGSTGVGNTLNQLSKLFTEDPKSTQDTSDAYETFHESYLQYLLDLNSPSVPNLIVLVVVLLGLVMAGTIAASPRSHTRMSTRVFLALSVFVVGLYQLPMWVLNSRKLVLEAVHPYLSPVDSASAPSGTGVNQVIVLLSVVIVILTLVLILPGFLGRRRHEDGEAPAPAPAPAASKSQVNEKAGKPSHD